MSTVGLVVTVLGLGAGTVLLWRPPTLQAATSPTRELVARLADTSVVIPARDEERTLPLLLASLAEQVVPPRQVIVVDDGSTDATSAVAERAGATVVAAPPPPVGWLGKPWACQQGVEAATGSTLVLLDADVVLAPDALLRMVAEHRDESSHGLLSVQPFHTAGPGVEQLSALANLVAVMASGMAAPGGAAAGRSPVAFGPCLVTSRAALSDVGGFAAARGSITEDVALAAAFRRDRRPVRCLAGAGTVRFRMYPDGWGPLVQGWSRNLAAGAGQAPLLPTVAATTWVAALLIVAGAGVGALLDLASGATPGMLAVVAWATVAVHLRWALAKVGAFRWWCAALFPVPLAAFVVLFTRSLALRLLRRPVAWRGRRVCHGAVLR